ncbi:MAG: hypothetical protein V4662_16400 [Verrucomicrobiota bacterium]
MAHDSPHLSRLKLLARGEPDARVHQIASVLLGMVALTALLLLGFAPVIWVFSTSTDSLGFMGFLVLVFWIIGLFFGARLLTGSVSAIGSESSGYLKVWIAIFTFQMSTRCVR